MTTETRFLLTVQYTPLVNPGQQLTMEESCTYTELLEPTKEQTQKPKEQPPSQPCAGDELRNRDSYEHFKKTNKQDTRGRHPSRGSQKGVMSRMAASGNTGKRNKNVQSI